MSKLLYPGLYSCFVSDVGPSSRQQRRASAWPAAAGDGAADSAGEEAIASHQPPVNPTCAGRGHPGHPATLVTNITSEPERRCRHHGPDRRLLCESDFWLGDSGRDVHLGAG